MTTKNTENSRTKVDGQVGIAGEEARGWYGALDKNKKAAIRELTKLQPRWNLVILMYLGIWVASAVLMAVWPAWPIQVAGSLLIGLSIHGMFNFMHEGIHGNLFRNKRADRAIAGLRRIVGLFRWHRLGQTLRPVRQDRGSDLISAPGGDLRCGLTRLIAGSRATFAAGRSINQRTFARLPEGASPLRKPVSVV